MDNLYKDTHNKCKKFTLFRYNEMNNKTNK